MHLISHFFVRVSEGTKATIVKAARVNVGTSRKPFTIPNSSAKKPRNSGDNPMAIPALRLDLPIAKSGLSFSIVSKRSEERANCIDVPMPTANKAINEVITISEVQKTIKEIP